MKYFKINSDSKDHLYFRWFELEKNSFIKEYFIKTIKKEAMQG